jgi:hypothetical protein
MCYAEGLVNPKVRAQKKATNFGYSRAWHVDRIPKTLLDAVRRCSTLFDAVRRYSTLLDATQRYLTLFDAIDAICRYSTLLNAI